MFALFQSLLDRVPNMKDECCELNLVGMWNCVWLNFLGEVDVYL